MKRSIFSIVLMFAAIAFVLSPSSALANDEYPLEATVEMTHLGWDAAGNWVYRGTQTLPHCGLTVQLARVDLPKKEKDPATGTITIYAANGDQIFIEFIQWWDPTTQAYVGDYSITGGTGIFADASGDGFIATEPGEPGSVIVSYDGTISY